MTGNGAVQLALYLIVLLLLVKPLGLYMARVYEGKSVGLDRGLGWLERLVYRAGGIRPDAEVHDREGRPGRVCDGRPIW